MFLFSIVVIGALLSERFPYLKRQVNFFFLLIIINTRVYFIFHLICLLYLFFMHLYSLNTLFVIQF
jgi:hypothetical protein